jgi:hypothetical protein
MKYYLIKSPLLLVISLIVPNCRISDIRDTCGPSSVADRNTIRSDKDRAISVDGIVELY